MVIVGQHPDAIYMREADACVVECGYVIYACFTEFKWCFLELYDVYKVKVRLHTSA